MKLPLPLQHATYTRTRLCLFLILLLGGTLLCPGTASAQCPPNIDFETGTFQGWNCFIGRTYANGNQNAIELLPAAPTPNQHTILHSSSGELDPYGGFPVTCPNGSDYSIRLGNNLGGGEAEGISYEFTIPAGQNVYSLIYHYAVVFQDPNHEEYQQPRMVVEVTNVTDDKLIECSSFSFIPFGSVLPGFFISPVSSDDGTPVWCKNWSAVTVNLNGHAGKTIRLFFKTADCTFRRHFGYAYIDVNSECSDEFVGARYCPDDTAVNIVAPYGYQSYTWFNSGFTQTIGSQQTISFKPPPPTGTTIAVQVEPYAGYGCLDTLYAHLLNNLVVTAEAGPDLLSCNGEQVQIGKIPKPGLTYTWTPSTGLSNVTVANPFARPLVTTQYVLSVRNSGGGCLSSDTCIVKASVIDNDMELLGKASYCLDGPDSSVLKVDPVNQIQWYRDNSAIAGANDVRYRVTRSGDYFARLTNTDGCSISTERQTIYIEAPKPGIRYPLEYAVDNLPLELQARPFGISTVWAPPVNLDQPSSIKPIFKGIGDYLYTIRIETAAGCITIDTQMVKTVKRAEIYVPTAFTPNKDGRNDVLRPLLVGVKELRYFRVYNRWGELLFETHTASMGWDGRFRGKEQGSGVVVWMAEGVGVDGRVYQRQGTSALIR